jgi:hypothetical protein
MRGIGQRDDDCGGCISVAHVILNHYARSRSTLFMAYHWIERDLKDHASKGLSDHQKPSLSTSTNSSASARFIAAFAA